MKSNLIDIDDVRVHHQTAAAYLVSTSGKRSEAVWVPKQACEFEASNQRLDIGTLTLEEDLAIEKGLV